MPEDKPDTMKGYHSFLLRLWLENDRLKESGTINSVWRASLKNSITNQIIAFSSLEELCIFLYKITEITEKEGK